MEVVEAKHDQSVESKWGYISNVDLHEQTLNICLLAPESHQITLDFSIVGNRFVAENMRITGVMYLLSNVLLDAILLRHVRLNGGTNKDTRSLEIPVPLSDQCCGPQDL
jgi:hypothetical protein